jgi:hypothetical protein
MANRKNTRNSTRKSAIAASNQHSGREAWADFNKFVSEHQNNEDLAGGGGLALVAWFASLAKDAERAQQSQVDAAIGYLDSSITA